MRPRPFPLLPCLVLLSFAQPVAAQQPTPNSGGFGAFYRDRALDPVTGSGLNLGVAVDAGTGEFFVSATGATGQPPHQIHRLDGNGALLGSFAQPAIHNATSYGIRDLEFDGACLIGGSEAGISVFAPNGALVNQVLAHNGPQPITQPITGPVASLIAVFRAVALDKNGRNGDGSLLVADFGSPIYEIDLQGNLLATFPAQGWSAYGLTIDPVSGNPWVFAGPSGQIEELDRATMAPTGRRLPPIVAGAPGGLALASTVAGHHEPWATEAAFVHLVQANVDHLAVQRVHLFPGVPGWTELSLEMGKNGGPTSRAVAPFWYGDALDFKVVDPTGLRNGLPVWFVFNVYFDANRDGYTDLTPVLPGTGVLWEHRSLNAISVPSTPNFLITSGAVGVRSTWTLPPWLVLADQDLFRMQALYFEPASPQQGIASSNEGHWQAHAGERGIVVAAAGPTSFHGSLGTPFWSVRSDATHGHGAILGVELSTIGASGPAALQRFDIDQNSMNDRFDGGNSVLVGHLGTYRNGTAASCGLDFLAAGVHVAPFHLTGESAGARFSVPPDPSGYVQDLVFAFTAFTPGKVFEFDCDTDGGPPTGADHAGMIVRVTTANSGVLTGVLQVDPNVPDRAVVWFP